MRKVRALVRDIAKFAFILVFSATWIFGAWPQLFSFPPETREAQASTIDYAFTEVNTQQTTTNGSYVDVPGGSIASGNFTAGKKYLIYITAQMAHSDAFLPLAVRTVHGSTAFAESESQQEIYAADSTVIYSFVTVWTAVASEGIKLQFRDFFGGDTAKIDQIAMLAINVSDDLEENTDWFFAERGNDDTLGSTPTDGASITFTPAKAGDDWLVLTHAQYDIVSEVSGNTIDTKIDRSGEAASSRPYAIFWGQDTDYSAQTRGLANVFTLGAAENTFKEISSSPSNHAHIRTHSSIFALRLNAFRNHAFAYTQADASLSATDYATELQTLSFTPDAAGDVWMGAYWGFDKGAFARAGEFRMQVDGSDQPSGQTTDNYQFYDEDGADESGEYPILLSTVANLTAASHTIDLDASADSTTGAPAGQDRLLWAVSMELAPVGPVDYQGPWYDVNWGYRNKFTIDAANVAGAATSFPVLINSTREEWRDTTHSGSVGSATGWDFVFTASDGFTKLDHEIEKFASTTGELVAWVEVPFLSSTSNTVLYAYYGNAAAEDQQNKTGVWTNSFRGVWP